MRLSPKNFLSHFKLQIPILPGKWALTHYTDHRSCAWNAVSDLYITFLIISLVCKVFFLPEAVWLLRLTDRCLSLILHPSADIWNICILTNVRRGVSATPTSCRRPSTVTGERGADRALAAHSSPTRPMGHPQCSPLPNSPCQPWVSPCPATEPLSHPYRKLRKVKP